MRRKPLASNDFLTKRKHFDSRLSALKTIRQNYESDWKEIRNYLAPDTGAFDDPVQERTQKKDAFYKQNINTLPSYYMTNLATALTTNLTPSRLKWFRLVVPNVTREESIWLKRAEDKMYRVFNGAGLYDHLWNAYYESALYGPSMLGMQFDVNNGIDFIPTTIGEFWISEGGNGLINTCYRRIAMTNAQIFEQFPEENIPEKIKEELSKDNTEDMKIVIHAVEPNPRYLPNWDNMLNKPYISAYYIEGFEGQFLEYKGFSKFPYMVARWNKTGKNTYGNGIGRTILGDIKSLQAYERDLAKASKKKISPPLKGSLELKNSVKDTSADSITYTDDVNGLTALYNVNYDTRESMENISRISQRIYQITYNDLFYALLNYDKTMSATQADGIIQEKLTMLGSVVERLQSEFLKPLINGAFNILYENGWFEEPPASLVGKNLDIQYQSLLSISQEMGDLTIVERYMRFVSSIAGINPIVARKPDYLATTNYYAERLGLDQSLNKTDAMVMKEVQDEQLAAAQQQQQAQQMQALQTISQATKNFAGAETNAEAALRGMVGA